MEPSTSILATERVLPISKPNEDRVVSLSLLDSTSLDFSTTSATWLFCSPSNGVNWPDHLRQCLRITLNAYPHWCGQLGQFIDLPQDIGGISALPNAQRYGRVYIRYGTPEDPGVLYITASSTTTIDALYPASRPQYQPLWNHEGISSAKLVPSTSLADPRKKGLPLPMVDAQFTRFACGGFGLTVRCAHPLADAQALVQFVQNWASVSQSVLRGEPFSPRTLTQTPIFDPAQLDARAAGDINASKPDPTTIQQTQELPFHRYDWWIPPTDGSTRGARIPPEFQGKSITPAGIPIPWAEWDTDAPVSHYTIHFTHNQVETLFRRVTTGTSADSPANPGQKPTQPNLTRHDAVLAHIWTRIIYARNQQTDPRPIHCDLTLGTRLPLGLPATLLGSFVLMANVEIVPASTLMSSSSSTASTSEVTTATKTAAIARRIREIITKSTRRDLLAAHLHSIAFEGSPQRIWQGFLGSRHLMVTSWARAGLYEVDFGIGLPCFAEGVVSPMDGLVLIQEGPPTSSSLSSSVERDGKGRKGKGWTENGVDVSVRLRTLDMERLLRDEELFGGL